MQSFCAQTSRFFFVVCLLGACVWEVAEDGPPCADEHAASCSRCLSDALEKRCSETEAQEAQACSACLPMSAGCDRESCEAARQRHWQCWDEAARSLCGSAGLPPFSRLPGGAGGRGGSDGAGGKGGLDGTGGVDGGGGQGGSGGEGHHDPFACLEMCDDLYRGCDLILPGLPTMESCELACDAAAFSSEEVACLRAALCGPAAVAACLAVAGAGGSGGADAGAGGSGGSEAPLDFCRGIPPEGICDRSDSLLFCRKAPGQNKRTVFRWKCETGATCQQSEAGAACVRDKERCTGRASYCEGNRLHFCESDRWTTSLCDAGCKMTPYGGRCEPGEGSELFTGTLAYEARLPKANLSGMGELVKAAAGGLLVSTYHDQKLYDAGWVQEDGSFSIRMPASRSAERDQIRFFTYDPGLSGELSPMAVMLPRLPKGRHEFRSDKLDPYPHYWTLSGDAESGRNWVVREDRRSAAIFMFQWMRHIAAYARLQYDGERRPGFLLWWDEGIDWSTCLGCYVDHQVNTLGAVWRNHVLVSDRAGSALQWSPPFLGHELGHWIMDVYGHPPGEGGRHCAGVPSLPGLAWSEGWASFFSSDLRGDSRYWAQQEGTFWWMDFSTMRYYGVSPFPKPSPHQGLQQRLPEEWVAGALWKFSRHPEVDPNLPHRALASPRMTEAPFERGYTAKRSKVGEDCEPFDIVDTRRSAPMLADYLDALRCGGASAALVESLFSPYPYPADQPFCR